MTITGIICEYNPFHRGHEKQLAHIKSRFPEGAVVCLMSGRFVQRGHPAVFDPLTRAKAAMACGADLVLELPVNVSLSSAEGFAAGGVEILSRLGVDRLCFGTETEEPERLMRTAEVLLKPAFPAALREELEKGLSFPSARSRAVEKLGADPEVLCRPNDILAVEYTKAVLSQKSPIELLPIHRKGDYHDTRADRENPSATALRELILGGASWLEYVPEEARTAFEDVMSHSLFYGERAVLGRLRSMTEEEFSVLPYGSEGLWRKLMRCSHKECTLEDILSAVKSKRYTRSRLDRMVMCAFLGLTQDTMAKKAPYIRVLACGEKGRQVLRQTGEPEYFVNLGKTMKGEWAQREICHERLYGLFARETEPPEQRGRIVILP